MENNVIEMVGITKSFPGIKANDNISLTLKKGEIHALLGENGAGKSTLMSILFGLYEPDEGKIFVNGIETKIKNPNEATKFGIGMVHQHFKLVECYTALQNIILGYEPTKFGFLRPSQVKQSIIDLCKKYKFNIDINEKIENMSVGDQQKVEILKMLYRKNDILIFDEPTAVLTPQEIDDLMESMKELVKEGKSILFISHKLNEIMKVADEVTVLRKGKVVGNLQVKDTNVHELSKLMVGRDVELVTQKDECKPGDLILEVKNLNVYNEEKKKETVKNLSLNVRAGEIVCLAGIEGNGQTDLVYAITGLEKVKSGEIVLHNVDRYHYSKKILESKEKENKTFKDKCNLVLNYLSKAMKTIGLDVKTFFHNIFSYIKFGLETARVWITNQFYKLGFLISTKVFKKTTVTDKKTGAKIEKICKKAIFSEKSVLNQYKYSKILSKKEYENLPRYYDAHLENLSIRDRSKAGISHIPEDRHKHGLVLDFNLRDNIVLQKYFEPDFEKFGFIDNKSKLKYANEIIDKYDVRSGSGAFSIARSMSGGNQQKAILGREIDRGTPLLIAVQPTRGLDVGAIEHIHKNIIKSRDEGHAVLLVSLELDEVMNLSDVILVMYNGEIVAKLDPKKTNVNEIGLYMSGAKRMSEEEMKGEIK